MLNFLPDCHIELVEMQVGVQHLMIDPEPSSGWHTISYVSSSAAQQCIENLIWNVIANIVKQSHDITFIKHSITRLDIVMLSWACLELVERSKHLLVTQNLLVMLKMSPRALLRCKIYFAAKVACGACREVVSASLDHITLQVNYGEFQPKLYCNGSFSNGPKSLLLQHHAIIQPTLDQDFVIWNIHKMEFRKTIKSPRGFKGFYANRSRPKVVGMD